MIKAFLYGENQQNPPENLPAGFSIDILQLES